MSVALASAEYALAAFDDKIVVVWGESDLFNPLQVSLRGRVLSRSDLTDVVAPRTLATADAIRYPVAAATAHGVLVVFADNDAVARVVSDAALNNPSVVQRFEGSRKGRAHAIATKKTDGWLVAYPASTGAMAVDLRLQALTADGALAATAIVASHSRSIEESSPWLAEDGAGNLALTFHDQGSGGLNLWLFRSSDLQGAELTPVTSLVVSDHAGTCTTDACRSSSVAWTRGYWTVLFALENDMHSHTIQARIYGPRGALGADGSPPLTLANDAEEAFAPHAATLDSGVTAFVTSAGANTRYARWGCL
jgi:hypothetical protein